MDLGLDKCDENACRVFYQEVQRFKNQLNPSASRLISSCQRGDIVNQERLLSIIREHLGDVNLVLLVYVLVLLSAANQDTLVVYQKAYNNAQVPVECKPSRREEELDQQLMDVQKRLVKIQKENEQVR